MSPPTISPMPPVARDVGLPWDVEVADPVAAIAAARAELGDTFVVDSGRDRYLFVFSPLGVESFYALPEERASKGLADFRMLSRKLPDEIFAGRRTLPSELFRRDDVAGYLVNLEHALDVTVEELGESGETELFALTRRLGHRMGLASWAGPGCADGLAFERLVSAFDTLDGSDAFVHPDAMAAVRASGKAAEVVALAEIVDVVSASFHSSPQTGNGLFARICDAWSGEPDAARGIALDVALIHIASMSNLAAALGWLLVDLATHEYEQERVVAGDSDLARRCALESTRLAQRSIMARYVQAPIEIHTERGVLSVASGATVATLLPLTNTSAGPGLADWRPGRWQGHRLAEADSLPSPQLVTAFGHGKHSCPAQPFSLAAMTLAATTLFATYDVTAAWTAQPRPVPAQIGGVARAAGPCPAVYRLR